MNVLLFIFGLVSVGIILLVFCIFYLIVMTRRKDIGVLKSCGVSSTSVAGLFVLFGTVVGVVGAVAGIGLGWLIIENINAIEQGDRLGLRAETLEGQHLYVHTDPQHNALGFSAVDYRLRRYRRGGGFIDPGQLPRRA